MPDVLSSTGIIRAYLTFPLSCPNKHSRNDPHSILCIHVLIRTIFAIFMQR